MNDDPSYSSSPSAADENTPFLTGDRRKSKTKSSRIRSFLGRVLSPNSSTPSTEDEELGVVGQVDPLMLRFEEETEPALSENRNPTSYGSTVEASRPTSGLQTTNAAASLPSTTPEREETPPSRASTPPQTLDPASQEPVVVFEPPIPTSGLETTNAAAPPPSTTSTDEAMTTSVTTADVEAASTVSTDANANDQAESKTHFKNIEEGIVVSFLYGLGILAFCKDLPNAAPIASAITYHKVSAANEKLQTKIETKAAENAANNARHEKKTDEVKTDVAVVKTDVAVVKTYHQELNSKVDRVLTDVAELKTNHQELNSKMDRIHQELNSKMDRVLAVLQESQCTFRMYHVRLEGKDGKTHHHTVVDPQTSRMENFLDAVILGAVNPVKPSIISEYNAGKVSFVFEHDTLGNISIDTLKRMETVSVLERLLQLRACDTLVKLTLKVITRSK